MDTELRALDVTKLNTIVTHLKSEAVEDLEGLAKSILSNANRELGGALSAAQLIVNEDTLEVFGGLANDFVREARARRELWRVREVACFCALRILAAVDPQTDLARALRQELAKRKVLERRSEVQRVLNIDISIALAFNRLRGEVYGEPPVGDNVVSKQGTLDAVAYANKDAEIAAEISTRLAALATARDEADKSKDP
eukprot:gene19738-24991_t